MGLIWKGEGGTANLKKKKKRAIGVWSSIKYFVTLLEKQLVIFQVEICHFAEKNRFDCEVVCSEEMWQEQSWEELCPVVKCDPQSSTIKKYLIFHTCICVYFVWFCLKALFVFANGVECN